VEMVDLGIDGVRGGGGAAEDGGWGAVSGWGGCGCRHCESVGWEAGVRQERGS